MHGPGHDVSEARSALRLRAVLASLGLVLGVAGAVIVVLWFPRRDEGLGFAVALGVCVVMAVTAVIDLVVISRRRRQRAAGR